MIIKLFSLLLLYGTWPASSCPTVSSYNCVCDTKDNPKWTSSWSFTCFSDSQIDISFVMDYSSNKELKVECVSLQKLTPELFVNITEVSRFYFIHCRSDFPLYDLLNRRSLTKLKFYSLEVLDVDFFDNLEDLKFLDLSRNSLLDIPKGLFDKMKSLKILNLSMNNIVGLDGQIFRNLSNLTHLSLSSNEIASFPEEVFSELINLQALSLYRNNLSELPEGIFRHLVNLKFLDVSFNEIEKLPKYLTSKLVNLLKFEFRNNLIDEIPSYFFSNNPKLEIIDLSGNKLDLLSYDLLAGLKNLEIFKASNNRLKMLPPALFSFNSNLSEINLRRNLIQLPSHFLFINNSMLKILDLSENPLSYLESKLFYKQYNLERLSLTSCNLLSLPDELFKFTTSLKYLDLSENKLSDSSQESFSHLPNLEHLKLKNNYIEYLNSSQPFGKNTLLKTIDLSHNFLTSISNIDWFYYPQLKSLNLQHNRFSTFSVPKMYSNDLQVYLQHNNISSISINELKLDREFSNTIKKREEIKLITPLFYFYPNPLRCDCDLYNFYQMVKGGFTIDDVPPALFPRAVDLVCSNPSQLAGKKLINVQEEEFRCAVKDNCPNSCSCFRRSQDDTVVVNCTSRQLTTLPEMLPQSTSIVHLENNQISDLKFLNSAWENCTELYLSNNAINSLNGDFPKKLQKLTLNNNRLTDLSSSFLRWMERNKYLNVSLAKNPYKCNCSRDIRYDLIDNYEKIVDFQSVHCNSTTVYPCLIVRDCHFNLQVILFIIAVVILSTFLIFILIHYYRRKRLFDLNPAKA